MEPVSYWAKSLRSGLSRLRSHWQHNGCTRHVVVGLLTHLILVPPLVAVLLFYGIPLWVSNVVGLFCALLVAYAIEKAIDAKLCE